ncbi:hypothetical protein HDV00_009676 [Rhizophlyctis rosea]|nr:hypothetical protein HDV00_009676 [Rhizophlyctis rosea]
MSEEEKISQVPESMDQEEPPAKKSGRAVMTEKKLANLAKAREARKAQLEAKKKKYPVSKRPALEKKMEEIDEIDRRIQEEADRKLQDYIERQKREAELQELEDLRKWKKQQEEDQGQPAKQKPATKKKSASAAAKKPPPKRKKTIEEEGEISTDEETPQPTRKPARGRATQKKPSNYYSTEDDYGGGGYDILDGVL